MDFDIRAYDELCPGMATLRLRPFIIGYSNEIMMSGRPAYIDLIEASADAGAMSISTEFFCLENRSAAKNKNETTAKAITTVQVLRKIFLICSSNKNPITAAGIVP